MALKVVYVASEAVPFAKTGGLADVAGTLPLALSRLGLNVALFIPLYRSVQTAVAKPEDTGIEVTLPVGLRNVSAKLYRTSTNGVPVYFIKRDEFYDRTFIYGTPEEDYFDNLERFAFFSRAVVEACKARGIIPDIIHCNDWQTGLVAAYIRDTYKRDPFFARTKIVFTIHNIAYQGIYPSQLFELTGLSRDIFTPDKIEFWGQINLMKAGIVFSDIITTVSEGYRREILTPEYGHRLDGVLRVREKDFYGVLNGVDYTGWDPSTDRFIKARYSIDDLSGKRLCKADLIKEFGLNIGPDTPVAGVVSRLADQKGLDILCEAMDRLMELGLAVVILGTGDRGYHIKLTRLAGRYPRRLGVKIAFDEALAHKIEAGADIFLMPSKYEPCGLNQIYSLRYGTIPVVRATGGLDDTIKEYRNGRGTGFKFREYSAEALVKKVAEALRVYRKRRAWEGLQKRAMKEDFSWYRSAKKYAALYKKVLSTLPNK